MSRSRRALLFAGSLGLALSLAGCFSLDPFLYTPKRTDAYVLELDGGTPDLRINADQVEVVSIPEDGGIQLGAIYVKATVQPPLAYLYFLHGKGNSLVGEFSRVKRFANSGFDVLDIDYRGFGTSTDVTPTEAGIDVDTKVALEWMVAHGAPRDQIFYYGHSFGTAPAAQRAITDPPFLLVLESAFASIAEFKRDSSSLDFPVDFLAKDTWDTVARARQLHVPLLLIHGTVDDYVRPEFSQQIYDASPNPPERKQLILVPGAAHDDCPERMGDTYAATLREWVSRFKP